MPISNNLRDQLRYIAEAKPYAVNSSLVDIFTQQSNIAPPPCLSRHPAVPQRHVSPLQSSTQINRVAPTSNDKYPNLPDKYTNEKYPNLPDKSTNDYPDPPNDRSLTNRSLTNRSIATNKSLNDRPFNDKSYPNILTIDDDDDDIDIIDITPIPPPAPHTRTRTPPPPPSQKKRQSTLDGQLKRAKFQQAPNIAPNTINSSTGQISVNGSINGAENRSIIGSIASNTLNGSSTSMDGSLNGTSNEIKLLQDYIRICEAKINLLTERNTITESTSISLDDKKNFLVTKYQPRFNKITSNQQQLRDKLSFLQPPAHFNDSDFIANLPQLESDQLSTHSPAPTPSVPTPPVPTPPMPTPPAASMHMPLAQIPDTIPPNAEIKTQEQLDGIDFNSDFSDTNIEDDGTAEDRFKMNLDEARQIVMDKRARNSAKVVSTRTNIDDDDEEDNFGDRTMDGLLTPSQDRILDVNDLGSFIDDNDDVSIDDSYQLTQKPATAADEDDEDDDDDDYLDGDQLSHDAINHEVDDIKLSQDVAARFGLKYDEPNSEIDLTSDAEDNSKLKTEEEQFEETIEEIDDVDFMTQLNQERELTNNDIIEISSDDDGYNHNGPAFANDDDDDVISSSVNPSSMMTQFAKPAPIHPMNILPDPHTNSDGEFEDSDDEELLQLMSTTVRAPAPEQQPQHLMPALPSDTQVPLQVPTGSEPFIRDVYSVLLRVFRLDRFRPNQLEAVTATLTGKDVFVLMPTGGGKSLCYQLPALIKSGKTRGTTIVISPLISLMQDQVQHLLDKNIKAGMISSKGSDGDKNSTIRLFRDGFLDLVYLSPEMINASSRVQGIIDNLYNNQQLARVVVDEAHCVSSWGHDFRPDYKGMNMFKKKYPQVPIMALTATANEKVRLDIVHHLQMSNPLLLKQSFNRTNLFYEVKWKNSGYLEWIKDFILTKHKNQTGIIYCHSKQSCEMTSDRLNSWGIKTSFYHAGMDPGDRLKIQSLWQTNQLQLICATIAFGMGIDKPDVRFVIHLFLPRTLEGYYQETGRAGRDGQPSECIMFYGYKDARSLQNFINRDDTLDDLGKESHLAKLRQVVQYCDNTTDCRRKQVLQYFNEQFDPVNCRKQCDNCAKSTTIQTYEKDFTEHARAILSLVESVQDDRVTVLHCQDIYRGSKNSKVIKMNHHFNPYHGKGAGMNKTEAARIFFHLLSEGYLMEFQVMKGGFASNYVKLGRNAGLVLHGGEKVKLMISESTVDSRPNSSSSSTSSGSTKNKAKGVSLSRSVVGTGGGSNLNQFRFRESFVSAREELMEQSGNGASMKPPPSASTTAPPLTRGGSIIELPANEFQSAIDESIRPHVEYSYQELNNLRIQKSFEIGIGHANHMIHDVTLKDMAIRLPTNKKDFGKLKNITKAQQDYFMHFKVVISTLAKERKKYTTNSTTTNANTTTTNTTNTASVSPYFNASQQDQSILTALRSTYSQSADLSVQDLPKASQKKGFRVSKPRTQRSQRGGMRRGSQRGSQRGRGRGAPVSKNQPRGLPL